MQAFKRLGLLVSTALLMIGCSSKGIQLTESDPAPIPFFGTTVVHRFFLNNGLDVLVVEDSRSPTFSYQTWFKVGSRNEVPGYTGLAHLFEHLMFKGTIHHPDGEFFKLSELAGAEGQNAYTTQDYTAYVQELPKERLDLISGLEADRMAHLIVDHQTFVTEREVVQNERRLRTENNPDGILSETLYALMYTSHPYRWPVLGYAQDLERMSVRDAVDFYKTHYVPNQAVIVVAGDVKLPNVKRIIQQHYGELKASPPLNQQTVAEPIQTSARHKTVELTIRLERLLMAYLTPPEDDPDTAALNLLEIVLCDGKAARMDQLLVDTGIAMSVGCGNSASIDPSPFVFSVTLQKGKHASMAEQVFLKEIQRLRSHLVTQRELQRAKNLIEYKLYSAINSNDDLASTLGSSEILLGRFEKAVDTFKLLQNLTAEDVRRVTEKYFSPEKRTVVTGVPKG